VTRPVQQRIDELADRARISLKFCFEHDRRSQGQKDRQTRERIKRIFADLEAKYGTHEGTSDGIRT
jgi:hypothetical protein